MCDHFCAVSLRLLTVLHFLRLVFRPCSPICQLILSQDAICPVFGQATVVIMYVVTDTGMLKVGVAALTSHYNALA